MPKDSSNAAMRRLSASENTAQWSTSSLLTLVSLCIVLFASFFALIMKMQQPGCTRTPYNASQLGEVIKLSDGSRVYEVVVVTDLDHDSKDPTKKNDWHSYLKKGVLTIDKELTKASVVWQDGQEVMLHSSIAAGGRSMELSDLTVFHGNLLSIDDRTGIVYKIIGDKAIPWVLLVDGAGNETKGFKGEWLTVKDGELWAGGLGKEWTTTEGVFVGINPMWVKRVTVDGCVHHINWEQPYKRLRESVGIHYPGYMIHESAQWSKVHHKWFFMPRRASQQKYTEAEDENRGHLMKYLMHLLAHSSSRIALHLVSQFLERDRIAGTNYLLIASEDFSNVEARRIGEENGPRGFSAFQFVPETDDRIIVALKSEEKDGIPFGSYITVFDVKSGHILLGEQPLKGSYKYEGIAFV
ncbi:unnamed protein product [Anisakis simplex]|uniref:Soluble calcium-activated nucleotidase 1 (inferred by orthology to a human protein) n=1 Tax=Anisakis simplex TaxID=6269 RepID=A0A0M3JTT9_ANISI|nr:unnamed protein product [Anisakis simplex]